MKSHWGIEKSRRATALALSLVVAVLAGCGPPGPHFVILSTKLFALDSTGRQTVPSDTFRIVNHVVTPGTCLDHAALVKTDSLQGITDTMVAKSLVRNGYCLWFIPEFNDDQRLLIASGGKAGALGPLSHVSGSPYLGWYQSSAAFDDYFVNVAIVAVDTTAGATLPAEYGATLQLKPGINCLYLHHDKTMSPTQKKSWQAVMIPEASGACQPTQNTTITAVALDVAADQASSVHPDDYPPVTRFVEAKDGRTYVGVRCGNIWCVVGATVPSDARDDTFKGVSGVGKSHKWQIRGWFDQQHLADRPLTGANGLIQGQQETSIVPVDTLGDITLAGYEDGAWRHVATIHSKKMTAKYLGSANTKGYGWKDGMNLMWLNAVKGRTSAGVDTVFWYAKFSPDKGSLASAHQFSVTRMDHTGYDIPPVARWRWSEKDELPWVECLAGCCMVEPDDVQ